MPIICWYQKLSCCTLHDCTLLRSDMNFIPVRCTVEFKKIDVSKTEVFNAAKKTNAMYWTHKPCRSCLTRLHTIKDMGVLTDSKTQGYSKWL